MPATDDAVAEFTVDGVVVSTDLAASATVLSQHPDARRTEEERELDFFYDNPAHAQIMLNERFGLQNIGGPFHDGVEVEERLALGSTIAIAPVVPCFTVIDEVERRVVVRTRAYARNMAIDRFALEVLE